MEQYVAVHLREKAHTATPKQLVSVFRQLTNTNVLKTGLVDKKLLLRLLKENGFWHSEQIAPGMKIGDYAYLLEGNVLSAREYGSDRAFLEPLFQMYLARKKREGKKK